MENIRTEAGVVIILIFAMIMVIFTVVGFDKTVKDMEKIDQAMQQNQKMLNDSVSNQVKLKKQNVQ